MEQMGSTVDLLGFSDVKIIIPDKHIDSRGWTLDTYSGTQYSIINYPIVREFQTHSMRGVVRGLHYQLTECGKLIQVVHGKIFDVVVDIQRSSPSFGKYHYVYLSSLNQRQLWIPPGFAHGFYVLSVTADVVYKLTTECCPVDDKTILWSDPDIGIKWPTIPRTIIRLSENDKNGVLLRDADIFD